MLDKIKSLFQSKEVFAKELISRQLIADIRDRNLTYLSADKLSKILQTCIRLEAQNIKGDFIEAGCALGGSTILIARSKRESRQLNVYDVFGMIPPPSHEDTPDVHERYKTIIAKESAGIGNDTYYGYIPDLRKVVEDNLLSFGISRHTHNVSLIEGLVQETLHCGCSVAFAHIDVDWYEPVKTCLDRIGPNLAIGGCVILDDYFDWGGCKKATDQFLEQSEVAFEIDDSARSRLLIRTS